jgi:hypothetical protein
MYLNKKAIKDFYKDHKKRVSAEVYEELDEFILGILVRSINLSGSFKTIKKEEIHHALGRGK